jgi:hypothetical protein
MKNQIERRRHPRVAVDWPVVVMTPQGAIMGKTENISANRLALLLFLETPVIDDEFKITLKSSEGYLMSVTCQKLWSDIINREGYIDSEIGARFTKISSSDRKTIATLVEVYQ